jgi:hypothetical protein
LKKKKKKKNRRQQTHNRIEEPLDLHRDLIPSLHGHLVGTQQDQPRSDSGLGVLIVVEDDNHLSGDGGTTELPRGAVAAGPGDVAGGVGRVDEVTAEKETLDADHVPPRAVFRVVCHKVGGSDALELPTIEATLAMVLPTTGELGLEIKNQISKEGQSETLSETLSGTQNKGMSRAYQQPIHAINISSHPSGVYIRRDGSPESFLRLL